MMRIISRQVVIKAVLGSASVCASSLITPSAAAYAQAADAGAANETAADIEAGIGEIVVTAQRRAESVLDVPISITAQSGEDLLRQGVTNTQDLTVAVPGLVFTKLAAFAQPTIRGVQTSISAGGAEASVALYVDGVYQANQLANLFDLPDVARVEVLKGPQGTLFGRNATGGAILIHTIEPSFKGTSGKLSLSDGVYFGENVKTANELTVKGYVNTPLSETLAFGAAGYYTRNPGFMTNDVTGDRYGLVRTYMGRAKLLFEPADTVRFLLTGNYSNSKNMDAPAYTALNGLSVGSLFPGAVVPNKPWHFASELKDGSSLRMNQWGVSLRGEVDIGNAGTAKSTTAYSRVNPLLVADLDASFSPACLAASRCQTPYIGELGPERTFQQELSFSSGDIGPFSFVAGVFYYHDEQYTRYTVNIPVASDGSVDPSQDGAAYAVRSTITTDAYSGFGEVNLDLTNRLRLIAGLRYSTERKVGVGGTFRLPQSEFADRSWDAWTPRLSALYELTPDVNIYATYSEGFKSGLLDSTTLSRIPVNPESLTSYEAGIKAGTRKFSASASAFYYDHENVQVQFRNGLVTVLGNAARARMYGFELDTSAQLSDTLRLRVGGSWLPYAKYKEFPGARAFDFPLTIAGLTPVFIDASGLRMLRSPKLTASGTLAYSGNTTWGTLDASSTLYYSSTYDHNFVKRVQTKAYALLNARVALTPTNSALTLAVFGKNLTNKAYIDAAALSGAGDNVHFASPRQIGVSIDYAF